MGTGRRTSTGHEPGSTAGRRGRSPDRLATSLPDRLRERLRPGRLRSLLVRRVLAAALLIAAVVLLAAGRSDPGEPVVVAAGALTPGRALTEADLSVVRMDTRGLSGLLHHRDQAVGRRLSGTLGAGEPVTASRLLDSRLPAALTGEPSARLVPVRPADPALAGLLRTGDVVDVLDEHGTVLARKAVVAVPVSGASSGIGGGSAAPPVLIAMPEPAALRVAAAGLVSAIALVIR